MLDAFEMHPWRGNVRELEHVLRRMVIDSGALVDADAARRAMRELTPGIDETEPPNVIPEKETGELGSLDDAERWHVYLL